MSEHLSFSQFKFMRDIANHMVNHFEVEPNVALVLAMKYIKDIDVEDVTVQHIGADYFAIQILMAEKVIPYKAI